LHHNNTRLDGLAKPKSFACVLSERVRLKDNIGRMFLSQGTIFPNGSVTLVSSNGWQKTSWQAKAAKSFDGCKIHKLKVGSMPTAYPADSRSLLRSLQYCNNNGIL